MLLTGCLEDFRLSEWVKAEINFDVGQLGASPRFVEARWGLGNHEVHLSERMLCSVVNCLFRLFLKTMLLVISV